MAQGRSIYKEIFRNFIESLKPKYFQYKFIGKDYLGTEYFESSLTPGRKKPRRWFAPTTSDDFEQEIPPEWEAWLRHRRKYPPTEEEIQINLAKMRQAVENARKLEKPPTISRDEIKTFEKPAFPKYDDFEVEPSTKENSKK